MANLSTALQQVPPQQAPQLPPNQVHPVLQAAGQPNAEPVDLHQMAQEQASKDSPLGFLDAPATALAKILYPSAFPEGQK